MSTFTKLWASIPVATKTKLADAIEHVMKAHHETQMKIVETIFTEENISMAADVVDSVVDALGALVKEASGNLRKHAGELACSVEQATAEARDQNVEMMKETRKDIVGE